MTQVPVVGAPSSPCQFEPQHWTFPAVIRAQVCANPAATAPTPLSSPTTSTGAVLMTPSPLAPLPNWPNSLLPKHFTPPAEVTAHVCTAPAATSTTPLSRPTTSTGTPEPSSSPSLPSPS